jgi:phosphate-selective porin
MRAPLVLPLLVFVLVSRTLSAQAPAASATPSAPAVRLSGYLQARETYQDGAGLTASINRARLAASGSIVPTVTWRIQGEFRTGSVGTGRASVSLQDAFIRYAREPWAVQAGQFKTPFTREFVTSLADVETADRSTVVDSLAPKRDIGIMGEYSLGKKVTVSVGAFNGEGQNVTANRDSSVLGVSRVVVRPIPAVALGANVARYFGDSTRYGADVNYEDSRAVARFEWVTQVHDGVDAPHDKGWFALAGYFVVPTIQLVGKYEWFTRDAISPQQKNRAWTAAANLYPWNRNTRLVLEYISRKIGEPGVRRGQGLAQFQIRF